MRVQVVSLAAAIVTVSTACEKGPSAPSPVSELGTQRLGLTCGQVLDGYQCSANIATGAGPRDVTGLATWSTSDASVATVNSVGFVTVLREGQVAVRASYQAESAFLVMTVEPGGLRRYYRALSGWVTDTQTGSKLTSVNVEVVAGPNQGRNARTGNDGAYQMYDLEIGTFTVRFSKTGYVTSEHSFSLSGDRFNSLDAQLAK